MLTTVDGLGVSVVLIITDKEGKLYMPIVNQYYNHYGQLITLNLVALKTYIKPSFVRQSERGRGQVCISHCLISQWFVP